VKGSVIQLSNESKMMLYDLDHHPPLKHNLVYGFQWLAFFLATIVAVPIVVGVSLDLDPHAMSTFIQRTFFFTGLLSIIQATLGHRLTILEGPGGMWFSLIIIFSSLAPQLEKPISEIRTDLSFAMLIVAGLYIILGLTGTMGKIRHFFTPIVKGTFLLLMPILLSGNIVRGILGLENGDTIEPRGIILALLVFILAIGISLRCRGFIQSVSLLIAMVFGWLAAIPLKLTNPPAVSGKGIIALPELFPWGIPTYDPGITLASAFIGFLIFSNLIASITTFFQLIGKEDEKKVYNRTVIITGFSNMIAGIAGVVGFIPFSATTGFVRLTRVASRLPFITGGALLMLMGLFPSIGALYASLPPQVGYAMLTIVFCQLIGLGLQEYSQVKLDDRNTIIIGTALLLGIGVMLLPGEVMLMFPMIVRPLLGNGLIVGISTAILMEHLVLREKIAYAVEKKAAYGKGSS
jgi:xanthine/uracil permease